MKNGRDRKSKKQKTREKYAIAGIGVVLLMALVWYLAPKNLEDPVGYGTRKWGDDLSGFQSMKYLRSEGNPGVLVERASVPEPLDVYVQEGVAADGLPPTEYYFWRNKLFGIVEVTGKLDTRGKAEKLEECKKRFGKNVRQKSGYPNGPMYGWEGLNSVTILYDMNDHMRLGLFSTEMTGMRRKDVRDSPRRS